MIYLEHNNYYKKKTIKYLLSSVVLADELQLSEFEKEGWHKTDLVGLCIDTGIEVMPLIQKFDSLIGGSQVLNGRSFEVFI